MSEPKVILQLRSLTLNHEPQLLPDVKDAILGTLLGTPDGIRYRLLDSEKKLNEIPRLNFFTLRKNGDFNFVMALCERLTYSKAKPLNTYYVRYVTFSPILRKPSSENSSPGASQRLGNSFIKEGMKKHAETFPFPTLHKDADPGKRAYYAYIEETNIRSLELTSFFMEKIRNFSITTYSNLFPKKDKNVSKLSTEDYEPMLLKLKESYLKHSFFFIDRNDIKENYFVLKKGGKIIAGLKAQVVNWKIEQVPGNFGKILKNVLPYIPIFSRLIKKDRFTFLGFDTLYCVEGAEKHLPVLFKSVCAIKKVYAAFLYTDLKEPMNNKLAKLKNMGFLNKMYKNAQGAIVARFINYSEEEKEEFRKNPVYVAGYDLA